jgi:hypothetical protein
MLLSLSGKASYSFVYNDGMESGAHQTKIPIPVVDYASGLGLGEERGV